MFRYRQPGGSLINLGGAVFAIVYIGMLGAFMALLRVSYGLMAVISMVFVTKMCDIIKAVDPNAYVTITEVADVL